MSQVSAILDEIQIESYSVEADFDLAAFPTIWCRARKHAIDRCSAGIVARSSVPEATIVSVTVRRVLPLHPSRNTWALWTVSGGQTMPSIGQRPRGTGLLRMVGPRNTMPCFQEWHHPRCLRRIQPDRAIWPVAAMFGKIRDVWLAIVVMVGFQTVPRQTWKPHECSQTFLMMISGLVRSYVLCSSSLILEDYCVVSPLSITTPRLQSGMETNDFVKFEGCFFRTNCCSYFPNRIFIVSSS